MHSVASAAWNWFPVYVTFVCNGEVTKFEPCLIMIHDFSVCVTLQSPGSLADSRLSCQQ